MKYSMNNRVWYMYIYLTTCRLQLMEISERRRRQVERDKIFHSSVVYAPAKECPSCLYNQTIFLEGTVMLKA